MVVVQGKKVLGGTWDKVVHMVNRDEVINSLSRKYDPRAARWEFRAILDVLQEVEPITVKDLVKAINQKYNCELFTYNALYNHIQTLAALGVVKSNLLKEFTILEEYVTNKTEIEYIPVSNYNVAIFILSTIGLMASVYYKYMVSTAVGVEVIGTLYILGQYLGSEFKIRLPKLFRKGKDSEDTSTSTNASISTDTVPTSNTKNDGKETNL